MDDNQGAQQAAEPTLEKRTWHYLQRPGSFQMAPCVCGNADPDWSEFKGRLWCSTCQVDFVPEHNGVFGGPIAVHTARLLGMSFDRFNMLTGKVEPFETELMRQKPAA